MIDWRGVSSGVGRDGLYARLVVILAVALVFMPVTGFEFLNYDDNINVYENSLIADFSWAAFRRFWSASYQGLYIPMTYSLWGGLSGLSGIFGVSRDGVPNPALFHVANLLIHLASVLVFLRLLRRLVNDTWSAAAGALLFALHPVQVEAVAWVTGLKDLLSGFFAILALERYYFYAGFSGEVRNSVLIRRYLLASLFFVLALLSKPSVVTVPLLAAVVGHFCLGRSPKLLARELLPWLLLAVPVLVVTRAAQPGSHGAFDFSWWQRLLVAGDALSFYLAKLCWPIDLAPDYGRTPALVLGQGWLAYATLSVPLGVAALLVWQRRAAWLWTGVLLFIVGLLPVLGLVPFDFQKISTVADRYLYLAMLGPGFVTAWLFCRFRGRWTVILVAAALSLLALASFLTVRNWHDSFVFNRHALQVNPLSYNAQVNLGVAYNDAGNFKEALSAYRRAVEIDPDESDAYFNLGNLHGRAGLSREAIAYYRQALARVPRNYGLAYRKIGDAHELLGEHEQALTNFQQALYYYQLAGVGGFELARVYVSMGLLYRATGRDDKSEEAYRKALLEQPDFAEVYSNLGVVYEGQGRIAEAEECYRQAMARKPSLAEPYNNLGLICLGRNRVDEALGLFRKAVELAPRQPSPVNNLGRAFLALGQYEQAIGAFQQTLRLDPGFAPALAGLARIYQLLGRGEQAGVYEAKARVLGYKEPLDSVAAASPGRSERP